MVKQMKRRSKNEDTVYKARFSAQIRNLFKKKGGIYAVARRNNLEGTNMYSRIEKCGNALLRVRKLLHLVDHDLEYKIVERKTEGLKK